MPNADSAIALGPFLEQIAVGEHDWEGLGVPAEGHPISGHDIGAVKEVGDSTKALGLALGVESPLAGIEAHELGIGLGVDPRANFQKALRATQRGGWKP